MSNRMTPIQHHAMCLAVGGFWQLADALELVHRHKGDNSVVAICHPLSSQTCIATAEDGYEETCSECDGTGYQECDLGHDHECSACDGSGGDHSEMLTWQTLNGEPVTSDEVISLGGTLGLADARLLISQYERLLERLQGNEARA